MDAMDDGTCIVSSCKQESGFGLSPKTITLIVAPILAIIPAFIIYGIPAIWTWIGIFLGGYVRRKTEGRHGQVLKSIEADEKNYAEKHQGKSSGNTKKGGRHRRGSRGLVLQVYVMLTC